MTDSEQPIFAEENTEFIDSDITEDEIEKNINEYDLDEHSGGPDSLNRKEHSITDELNSEEFKSKDDITVDTNKRADGLKETEVFIREVLSYESEGISYDSEEISDDSEEVQISVTQYKEINNGTDINDGRKQSCETEKECTIVSPESELRIASSGCQTLEGTPCVSSSSIHMRNLSQNFRISSNFSMVEGPLSLFEEVILEPTHIIYTDFTVFEIQVIAAILSEVFTQFKLIESFLPFPKFDWKKAFTSINDYFSKIMGNIPERLFTDYYEHDKTLLWKMQTDLYEINNIVYKVAEEINATGTYNSLVQCLDDAKYIHNQENVVIQENVYLGKLLDVYRQKYLKKEAELARRNLIEEAFETEEEKTFDCKVWHHIELRYIDSWEKVRRLQNTMKIEKEENVLIDALKDLAYQQRKDSRVSSEIETYFSIEIRNLEFQLEHWTSRYNEELEERDIELTLMYAEKESIDNRLKTLLVTFNEREEVVQEIQNFFAEREKEEEIKFQLNKAATIIQKWWKKYKKMKMKYLFELKLLKKLLKEQKAAKAKLKKTKKV